MARARQVTHRKRCTVCRQQYERRDNETATNYRRRKTCSDACGRKRATRTKGNAGTVPLRHCQQCGKRLTPTAGEGPKRFGARQYCSRECATAAQTKTNRPVKHCAACGGPIERKPQDSRWRHEQRTYCSRACAGRAGVAKRWGGEYTPKPPAARKRLAPEGYVFNGRFPTPKAATAWVPVTGPDATENVVMPARSKPDAGTRTALRAAIARHPELALALAEAMQ